MIYYVSEWCFLPDEKNEVSHVTPLVSLKSLDNYPFDFISFDERKLVKVRETKIEIKE